MAPFYFFPSFYFAFFFLTKALNFKSFQLEQIQIVKADKDYITKEMKAKADKREINLKVERDDFDRYIGMVDQSLRDLLQRLEGHVRESH